MYRPIAPFTVAALVLAATAAPTARAAFVAPAWDRPADAVQATADGTTYQAWDVFTGLTSQSPDAASVNPAGVAALDELTGGAFVTGGGNIYSPSVATRFAVVLPGLAAGGPGDGTNFHVQLRTLGSELDLGSLTLDGTPADALDGYAYAELDRVPLGGFGGSQVDHLFTFFSPDASADFALGFAAASSSMSLDRVSVDTLVGAGTVPEPAAGVTLLSAGLLALRRRRKTPVACGAA